MNPPNQLPFWYENIPLAVQHGICCSASFILQTMPPHDPFSGWYGSHSMFDPFRCLFFPLFLVCWFHHSSFMNSWCFHLLNVVDLFDIVFCCLFVLYLYPTTHSKDGSECVLLYTLRVTLIWHCVCRSISYIQLMRGRCTAPIDFCLSPNVVYCYVLMKLILNNDSSDSLFVPPLISMQCNASCLPSLFSNQLHFTIYTMSHPLWLCFSSPFMSVVWIYLNLTCDRRPSRVSRGRLCELRSPRCSLNHYRLQHQTWRILPLICRNTVNSPCSPQQQFLMFLLCSKCRTDFHFDNLHFETMMSPLYDLPLYQWLY